MRNLRVGIVGYPTPGGSGVVATELAHELARRGQDVHLFSYEVPFRLETSPGLSYHAITPPGHPVLLAPPYDMALAGTLAEVAARVPLDVIHVHYAVPHASSAFLASRMVGPHAPAVVVTVHGSDVTTLGADPALRQVLAFTLGRAGAVTAVSSALAESARQRLGLRRTVEVIPNFVNPEIYRRVPDPALRARYAGPDEAILIHASNFRPVKKVRDVVRIFARVAREVPARLLLVGEGPDCPEAYRQAVAEGVENRVAFLGVQPQIVPCLSIADLFLLPSSEESFGLSALEAMACGVPVVASNVGGLPEVVEHGRSGLLYPAHDVAGMAAGALSLLRDPALHARVAGAATERARSVFNADRVVPLYLDVYTRVRSGTAVPAGS